MHRIFYFYFYINKKIFNICYIVIAKEDKSALDAWLVLYCLIIMYHNILISVREGIAIILRFVCKQNRNY